jgi:hypothetical protein
MSVSNKVKCIAYLRYLYVNMVNALGICVQTSQILVNLDLQE